ncbi:MAG: 23S rRNA (adenine(2503)-C(2))-methyltransferase RlmN [Candidatus Pelagibacter sp. TMED272]|nr:23S rRNA (adenine(2503)-C(2))-methyltransferase RlmN [Pelagibacteraceae bacterium]RPG93453.1 MAG: 23S rRNA (adenine(2503)-C(2))-methyltransferase RlmN [Candidatus Pelagibacter sp. TMED272]|tara:strand:- start:5022 stop:6110 length:1089 start_codon:yes stop_codon:yes gene_type:complete
MEKQNFYDLNFEQLRAFLIKNAGVDFKKAKMRSQQLFNAVYKKNIKNFDELSTIGSELRNKINSLISLDKPKIVDIQKSKDGTIKFLLELKDKRNVETVLIPDKSQSRYTICLSVSVGCYLSCEFCATAQISKKLVRNLSPGEIISQIILCKDYINDWSTNKIITNIVKMGEGSPFLNLDNVKVAIDNLKNKDGLEYGRTRITVSTVGIGTKKDNLDAIEWAAKELDVYLAWSLHSSIPKHRSELMPINDKYSIKSLIPQLKKYYEKTKLPIFIEWICLEENLTDEHAIELIKIMKKVPSKLNLIEFNPISNKGFKAASQESVDKFSKIIQEAGFLSLFRRSRGRDINASCGSLANKKALNI